MSLLRQHLCGSLHRVQFARGFSNRVAFNHGPTVPKHDPRIYFSAIQPTGIPHLGNLLGALLNWVKLERDVEVGRTVFSIAGWHALTLPQDPSVLRAARWDTLAMLLALGLKYEVSILFHQDANPYHAELAWILNCITPMGKLRRMTTWKSRLAASRNARDESEVDESLLNVGLFSYPILQAADILAYRATHVPVGEDQQQHIELCRDVAETFNRTFKSHGPLFPLPQPLITSSPRIMSLKNPYAKMSKSASDVNSRILLTDGPSQIRSKIRGAVTDSTFGVTYDPNGRPGVANLLTILAACTGEAVETVAPRYADKGHADLKDDVADAVEELIKNPRAEFERLRQSRHHLHDVASLGAARARDLSKPTLQQVRERVGLAR